MKVQPIGPSTRDAWRSEAEATSFDSGYQIFDLAAQYCPVPESAEQALLSLVKGECTSVLLKGAFSRPDEVTPAKSIRPARIKYFPSEIALASVSKTLGQAFCYAEQSGGEMIHQVCPVRGKENAPTGENSLSRLALHSDGATHPFPPAFVVLACLRAAESGGDTIICDLDSALAELDEVDRVILRSDTFVFDADYELRVGDKVDAARRAVIYSISGREYIRYDKDCVRASSEAGRAALEKLEAAAERAATIIHLEVGDILVFDNPRTLHSRTPFVPLWDGRDRWLQSMYVSRSLPTSAALEFVSSRVLRVINWDADLLSW